MSTIKTLLVYRRKKPRLSWELSSDRTDTERTAYQIAAATTLEGLTAGAWNLWDSTRMESDQNISVEYGGKELVAHQVCFWKVRCWCDDDIPTAYRGAYPDGASIHFIFYRSWAE